MNIQDTANCIKRDLELAITERKVNGKTTNKDGEPFANGLKAKESLIRSSTLINHVHEYIKHELIRGGINPATIFPPLNHSKPELKITGMYKQKNQDVCVKPLNIPTEKVEVNWGPMIDSGLHCQYGQKLSEQIISINIRSQMSSLGKNSDTLFERTFAEALNLHHVYPRMVLGEVYVIPVYEYNDDDMKKNKVSFKKKKTDLEKYIKFFHYLSGRMSMDDDNHKYERCALVIVDFNGEKAKVYNTTDELKKDRLVKKNFNIELSDISSKYFVGDLLAIYERRFNNDSIFS